MWLEGVSFLERCAGAAKDVACWSGQTSSFCQLRGRTALRVARSMAAGVPVIATGRMDTGLVADGINCLLVEPQVPQGHCGHDPHHWLAIGDAVARMSAGAARRSPPTIPSAPRGRAYAVYADLCAGASGRRIARV